MYKAVVFDFFGVIQSDQYSVWLSKHGFSKQGEYSDVSKAANRDFISMQEYYEILSQLSSIPKDQIAKEFEEPQSIDSKVIDLIKQLSINYIVAIASNSNSDYLRDLFKKENLNNLFEKIFISGEIGFSKPSEQFFEYMVNELNLKPNEIIFIDDNIQNIESAKNLGFYSIHFEDAIRLKEKLSELDVKL